MLTAPKVALARMRDLRDPRGRASAIRVGESIAHTTLKRTGSGSQIPDPAVAARFCRIDRIERIGSLVESGRVQVDDGRTRILLRAGDASRRQRFTIAHELGHVMMGLSELNGVAAKEEESRCDRFARGFLVPGIQLDAALPEALRQGATKAVRQLSDIFQVFPEVAVERLNDRRSLDGTVFILALLRKAPSGWRVDRVVCDRRLYGHLDEQLLAGLAEAVLKVAANGDREALLEKDVRLVLPNRTNGVHGQSIVSAHAVATWTSRSSHAQFLLGVEPVLNLQRGTETNARYRSYKQKVLRC